MNLLQFIAHEIAMLDGHTHPSLDAIANGIGAFNDSVHSSDGQRAQAIADQILPIAAKYLPALGPIAAEVAQIATVFEPYLGAAVDAIEVHVGVIVANARPTLPDTGVAETVPAE